MIMFEIVLIAVLVDVSPHQLIMLLVLFPYIVAAINNQDYKGDNRTNLFLQKWH